MTGRQQGPRTEGAVVPFRRGVPYDNWKAIEMEILKALSNPRFGFSGLEYLVLMNLVLHQPYEDPANLSIGDLARITGQDRSNMRKLVLGLEGRKVIGRDATASRIWMNPKVGEWRTAADVKADGVLQHPTVHGVSQHPAEVPQHPGEGVLQHLDMGCPDTSEVGCCDTPLEPPQPPDDEPSPPTLEVEIHETHGENIFSPSATTRELEYGQAIKAELERCGKRMAELAYKLPDKVVMVGAPTWHQFRLLLERSFAKRATRGEDDFVKNELDYLREFVFPAIEDCPAAYRAQYSAWTKQFNFKLSECRKLGVYVNLWEDEVKARGGRSGYAPVSEGFKDPDFKNGVMTDEDKRAARDKARGKRAGGS